jgi:dTDP-4-amino-4,6-dideoxygalactose transaminase
MSPRRIAVWPTLPPGAHLRRPSGWLPFPLDQARCQVFSLARHALWNGCRALGLGAGDVVLAPAYHHGSEIEALLRAGLRIRYYELNETLEPDAEELESLLGPDVHALYLIHYLGFPQDAAHWRRWCDEKGLLLIEDAAQAFLATRGGRPLGSFGDLAIFCLYKSYGVPDGGAVICTRGLSPPTSAARTGMWRVIRRHAAWLAERRGVIGTAHLRLGRVLSPLHARTERVNDDFELDEPSTPPSMATTFLLPRMLEQATAERRREHYRFLLTRLGGMVPQPFTCLPEGACPFAFPVEADNAKELLGRLLHRGVVGVLFWLYPHPSLPVANFPRSRALRERVLALPVHQELAEPELQQIVDAVHDSQTLERAR